MSFFEPVSGSPLSGHVSAFQGMLSSGSMIETGLTALRSVPQQLPKCNLAVVWRLGEHSNTLREETVVFRGDNEDYKRKAEHCYEQFFLLEEACENTKYIFNLTRDRLDTIGSSIGADAHHSGYA
jgi:hypothetical protein